MKKNDWDFLFDEIEGVKIFDNKGNIVKDIDLFDKPKENVLGKIIFDDKEEIGDDLFLMVDEKSLELFDKDKDEWFGDKIKIRRL